MNAWPLFALTLRVGALELRPVTDAHLDVLASRLPDDVELDPRWEPWPGVPAADDRRRILARSVWEARAAWAPGSWSLPFAVAREGDLIGCQWLEGPAWAADRTVDSSSWLVPEARGQGIGRLARTAVLQFAFGALGAEEAVTSAWTDNAASLRVSSALGYEMVDVRPHAAGDREGDLVHLRLTRRRWLRSGKGRDVVVDGFPACAPWFA